MSRPKAYVIGAGLAGLSCALTLAERGAEVEVLESAPHAGGRCRSYHDPQLGMTLDNGAHLVLSGNTAVTDYLARIGATDALYGPSEADFHFLDLGTGERWTVRPNAGRLPWWVLAKARRPPGSQARDFFALGSLLRSNPGRRVDEVVDTGGSLWEQLMRPVLLAALNTEPGASSAELTSAVMRESLAKGGRACRPRIAVPDLSAAFVDPALRCLDKLGAEVRFGRRVRALSFEGARLSAASVANDEIAVSPDQQVVLATPPWVARDLVPELSAPDEFRGIVNAHFRVSAPAAGPFMLGVLGGTAEWIFALGARVSVTVSAADRLLDMERETLASLLWKDVATAYGLGPTLPPWQIVKEKRATFAATPEQNAKRPGAETRWSNLILAGDWVQTGLPATIEGALRSGRHAAELAIRRLFV